MIEDGHREMLDDGYIVEARGDRAVILRPDESELCDFPRKGTEEENVLTVVHMRSVIEQDKKEATKKSD